MNLMWKPLWQRNLKIRQPVALNLMDKNASNESLCAAITEKRIIVDLSQFTQAPLSK